MAFQIELVQDLADLRVDETDGALLLAHLKRNVFQLIDIGTVGLQLNGGVSVQARSVNDYLIRVFSGSCIGNFQLLYVFLPNFTLQVHCFEGYWVVGDNGDSVPDILGAFLLCEGNAASILSTQHWLHYKLKLLLASGGNGELLRALAIEQVSLHLQVDWSLLVRIFHNDFLLDYLLGLASYLDVLLSKRFFSVSDDLVLEVVEGEWIAHDEFGFGNVGPLGLEGDGEVADAVPLDGECRREGVVDDEVVTVLGRIGKPSDLDIPVALSVVDDWQILSHLASRRHVHLQDSLERLRLDSEYHSVPSYVSLGLVRDQNISGKLVNWVLTDNGKGDFVFLRDYFSFSFNGVSLFGLVLAFLGLLVGRPI